MTPEEKRIAIAEACGRPELSRYLDDERTALWAMHEAEKVLTAEQKWEYFSHLLEMCGAGYTACICATAAQRADAFIATLNLDKQS